MENWQAGLGKREADAEGFLYAELETRFQGQLCLPLWFDVEWTGITAGGYTKTESQPTGITGTLSLSSSGSVRKIAAKFTNSNTGYDCTDIAFFLYTGPTSGVVSVEIYTDTGGDPTAGSQLTIATETITETGLNSNYESKVTATASMTAGASYWIVVSVTGGLTIPIYDNGSTAATRKTYNGSTWSNSNYSFFWHVANGSSVGAGAGARQACIYNSLPHFLTRSTTWGVANALYKYSSSTVSQATALSAAPEAMHEFGGNLYICYGGSRGIDGWNGTSISNQAGVFANLFAAWNGYLWRAHENDVYYSVDGSSWVGPIQIGPDGYTVTGMAGLGDDMYVATEEAFYRVGAGDLVFGVMRWNNISQSNGRGMINHQGSLFIPTYSDLLRYGGAEIMSITPNKDEGLPEYKQGKILALISHNYWLFAVVAPATSSSQAIESWPLILAYNDQGWHHIGKLFESEASHGTPNVSSLCWDVANNYLWATGEHALYRFRLPTDHQNPYKDNSGNVKFFPWGFLETPWFHSGLKEIYKDCESVYITGENISSSRPVKVYWKDDDSTAWELLGTVTSNRQELRWSDYDTRPNTRQIKLALVMYTDDYTESPRVDAVRLKFMNMVADRWRWTLSIPVSDEQEMLDGDINIYTKEQQRTHLESLAQSVPPVIFEDVDGVQYEVKVLGASEQVEKYEYFDEAPNFTSVYSFTIEQATTTTYN